jgi:hypothetical protein
MSLTNPIWVVGGFFLLLFLGALFYGALMQRRRSDHIPDDAPEWTQSLNQASSHERMASVVSEQIEELIQQRMLGDSKLKDVEFDFATSADGGLEIWINEEQFSDINSIPDERIRTIIREVVDAYNQGAST